MDRRRFSASGRQLIAIRNHIGVRHLAAVVQCDVAGVEESGQVRPIRFARLFGQLTGEKRREDVVVVGGNRWGW